MRSSPSGGGVGKAKRLRIAFLHPDLGIGGAERLIVDAAAAMIKKNHSVHVYTSYFNPARCFEEARAFNVRVHGNFIPRHFLKAFHVFFADLRNVYLAIAASLRSDPYDVFICDQISVCHFVLRVLRPSAKILFYCHYPDQLLSARASVFKTLYRLPFDVVEEITTGMADAIVCNSNFTRQVFHKTFRLLQSVSPGVLHPCVDLGTIDRYESPTCYAHGQIVFLSINRFERKKNIGLAIEAMGVLRDKLDAETFAKVHLVIAGGYDKRVAENVEYFDELEALAKTNGLLGEETSVSFIRSFTDAEKVHLLQSCVAVMYTPDREHFGIVPLECMAAWRPVIAVASGGPLESVAHETTGYLCEQTPESFAMAMQRLAESQELVETMGRAARKHVQDKFSRDAFGDKLNRLCRELHQFGGAASVPPSTQWASSFTRRRLNPVGLVAVLSLLVAVCVFAAMWAVRLVL